MIGNKKKLFGVIGASIATVSLFMLVNGKQVDPNKTEIEPISFNGQQIDFTYTDDNSNENLIIKTDKQMYSSWDYTFVYFAIKNTSPDDQDIKIQFAYNGGADTSTVEEFNPQVPHNIEVPDYAEKETCKIETEMISKKEKEVCRKEQIGTHTEVTYIDEWGSLSKRIVEDLKSKNVKVIPDRFVTKEQVDYSIISGETKYFRAKITFNPKSEGEFYINAYGSNGAIGHLDPWYNSSWAYRIPITIDHTKIGSSTPITNFPILASTTLAVLKYTGSGGHVGKSDGTDILITESDGTTKLNHEIEKYASTTGETIIWFKSSATTPLSTTTDTVYYMYYGNAGAADQQNVAGVWDSDYKGVYHLPNGTTLNLNDSTSGGNNGTGVNSPTATAGQIDGAVNLAAASSQEVNVGNNAGMNITGDTTISHWIKFTSLPASGQYMISLVKNQDGVGAEWGMFLGAKNVAGTINYVVAVITTSGGAQYFEYYNATPDTTTWHFVEGTWNNTSKEMYLYVDGVQYGPGTTAGTNNLRTGTNNPSFVIGEVGALYYTDAKVDEARISTGVRPAGWITTEYLNQFSPQTFESFGTEEALSTARRVLLID